MIRAFLTQLGLFTTFYSKNHIWEEKIYRKGIVFIPFIGLILGSLLYLAFLFIPVKIRAFILLLLYILLTGGLHMDGYADSLDGILARRGPSRALEIMTDPLLGSFGILGLFILLLGYFSFFPYLTQALIILPALGRFGGLLSAYKNKYARKEGMGKLFVESIRSCHIYGWLVVLLFLSIYLLGLRGLISSLVSMLYSFLVGQRFKSYLGGMTGDTVGFVIESSQLVFIIFYLLVEAWI